MTLEVSDCTSVSCEYESDFIHFEKSAPKGLAAIPDSLSPLPRAPKPGLFFRFAAHSALVFLHAATWTVQTYDWIIRNIFGYTCQQKEFYRKLHKIAQKGNTEEIKTFLLEQANQRHAYSYLANEFASLPELYPHLGEILGGANVCLMNEEGLFCRRWSTYPQAYKRISSHVYQSTECYAIGHFLFWLDPEGHTRFQLENSPFHGFLSAVDHAIDFLRYKRDNEQQGVVGSSPHTEEYCIPIEVQKKVAFRAATL